VIPQLAQYLVVGVIVFVAAMVAAAKYLPKSWRQRIVYRFSNGSGKGFLARWLDKESGCGSGCDTCGSCAPTPALPEQDEQGRKVIQLHLKR
jgi:hypothetical protein